MGWDHNYRRLNEGEVILATDECQNDDATWSAAGGKCVGTPAPDPNYTSHRVFRRAKIQQAVADAAPGVDQVKREVE